MSSKWLWKRRQMESDMDEELRFHIDSYASDLISKGVNKEEAFRRARIEFGTIEARKEECRESLGLRLWDELRSDLRSGFRILRQSPLFTTVAVVSLALGIGANTAIFSLANEYLLKGMGVPDSDRLRLFGWVESPQGNVGHVWGGFERTASGESMSTTFPYPVYREMRRHNKALKDIAAFKDLYQLTATVDSSAESVNAIMVSGNFYQTLGVRLEAGRGINPEDDSPEASGAVVISDSYWASRFGRSADVLGKTINLNSEPVTIVGVNAPEFRGVRVDTSPQVFFPMALQQAVIPDAGGSLLNNNKMWWLYMIGPMRQGISDEAAAASLAQAFRNACHITMPYRKEIDIPRFALRPGAHGSQWSNNLLTKPLYLLLTISGVVLLIACANLANLLLARAAVRQREISLRLAMGAGRARIMRQIMTESMMLAFLGGAAGLLLGYLGRNIIPGLVANSWSGNIIDLRMDWRVFAFAFAVTTLTGLLFGIVPAWRSTQTDANATLKETGRMSTSRPKAALGKALVVVQIALSLLLIVGAGLFLQTLFNLHHAPTGLHTDHVILFGLNPPKSRFTPVQRVALYQRVAQGLSQIPGVEKSTSSEEPLLASGVDTDCYRTAEMAGMDFTTNSVGADFFETFGIPILAGRSLSVRDNQHAPRVAVINQTLARKIYAGRDPIGHSIASCDTNAMPMEIVGVSADSKFTDLRQSAPPTIYIPFAQAEDGVPEMTFEVRTAASVGSMAPRLRQAVHDVDHNLPLLEVRTQTEQIDATLQTENIFALLTSGFGVLAILLASIGIYGVMAYTVARRTNEIGIRMALGAETKTVMTMVLGETTLLACAGIVAGVVASLASTRVVASMLFGVRPTDAVTFAIAATLLLVVTLAASFIPAWRAASVDPMSALRHE